MRPGRRRPSRSTPTTASPTSAAARTRRRPSASRRSSCCRSPARTGAATRTARCSRASTAPRSTPRRSSRQHLQRLEEARARDHRKLGPRARPVHVLRRLARARRSGCRSGTAIFNALVDAQPPDAGRARLRRGPDAAALRVVSCGRPPATGASTRRTSSSRRYEEREFGLKPMNCPGHAHLFGAAALVLPRPAVPLRRARPPAPPRAERHAARAAARPPLHPGRRAHLLHRGAGRRTRSRAAWTSATTSTGCSASRCTLELSTRPENRARRATSSGTRRGHAARARSTSEGLEYTVAEGEGAFYAPKIDLHMTDSLGRSWQLGTVQLDYNLPERFGLTYTGADNAEHMPVMIHRALFGSFERFIGILIEHYAGEFPLWLAPVQAAVLPLADRHIDYAREVDDRAARRPACAPRSTTAPSRSAARSARRSCRRSRTCSWSATARPSSARSRCAATARATRARSRSTRPSSGSSRRPRSAISCSVDLSTRRRGVARRKGRENMGEKPTLSRRAPDRRSGGNGGSERTRRRGRRPPHGRRQHDHERRPRCCRGAGSASSSTRSATRSTRSASRRCSSGSRRSATSEVEFAGYNAQGRRWSNEELRGLLRKYGLAAARQPRRLRGRSGRDLEQVLDDAEEIGMKYVGTAIEPGRSATARRSTATAGGRGLQRRSAPPRASAGCASTSTTTPASSRSRAARGSTTCCSRRPTRGSCSSRWTSSGPTSARARFPGFRPHEYVWDNPERYPLFHVKDGARSTAGPPTSSAGR